MDVSKKLPAAHAVLGSLAHRMSPKEASCMRRIQQIRSRSNQDSVVGSWAQRSSIPHDMGRFLFGLIRQTKPRVCLELGTGIGISALYILCAMHLNRQGVLWSLEGDSVRAEMARQLVTATPWHRQFRLVEGPFQKTLPKFFAQTKNFDMAFIDDCHEEAFVLDLWPKLRRRTSAGGILIYDDIRWSVGMNRAWNKMRIHPRVAWALDAERFGVISLRA